MTLEEAIRTAIEYEVKVRDVYRDAATGISDERGRKVVQQLAAEEQDHVDYLTARLKEWKRDGSINVDAIPRTVAGPEQIKAEVARLKERMDKIPERVSDPESDLRMLEKALEVERETSGFYEKMVHELASEHQEMFRHFVEIERGHLAIVEAEIDSINGMGFWFGVPEFDLEA